MMLLEATIDKTPGTRLGVRSKPNSTWENPREMISSSMVSPVSCRFAFHRVVSAKIMVGGREGRDMRFQI